MSDPLVEVLVHAPPWPLGVVAVLVVVSWLLAATSGPTNPVSATAFRLRSRVVSTDD